MRQSIKELDPLLYTVAWIAPLEIEARAAIRMLDVEEDGRFPSQRGFDYVFKAGKVCGHNVVIATLPAGQEYGTGSAAALAGQMKMFFPNLEYGLLVGLAAGLPKLSGDPIRDIRLGDVLVALPDGGSAGLIAYTLGKQTAEQGFRPLWNGQTLATTNTVIRSAIASIQMDGMEARLLQSYYLNVCKVTESFRDPGQDKDLLYTSDEANAVKIEREPRCATKRTQVWYGPIGSGDTVMKSSAHRNHLMEQYGIIGLEMEAAGVVKSLNVGVIRGVCDYGDGHKNDEWRSYAAIMAAAYAKGILAKIGLYKTAEVPPQVKSWRAFQLSRQKKPADNANHMSAYEKFVTRFKEAEQPDLKPGDSSVGYSSRGSLQQPKHFQNSVQWDELSPDTKIYINNFARSQQQCYSSYSDPCMRDSFVLEDARGNMRTIDFATAQTWEQLHSHLILIYPLGDPGHLLIKAKRYLFHKDGSDDDILWQISESQSLRDVIMPGERIRMTVIFPYFDSYNSICPKCGRKRSAQYAGPILVCSKKCGLIMRFRDSHANKPDPLTKIAIESAKIDGQGNFVQNFLAEVNKSPSNDGVGAGQYQTIMANWLDDQIHCARLAPSPGVWKHNSKPKKPDLQGFTRVTVCTAQWPTVSRLANHKKALENLHKTIKGLQRRVEFIDAEDVPFLIVTTFLNSRFGNCRAAKSCSRFLTSLIKSYNSRRTALFSPALLAEKISHLITSSKMEFHPAAIRLRCSLWLSCEIFDFNMAIAESLTILLDAWAAPEGTRRESSPLFFKLFSLPHTMLIPIWRLTFDLAGDLIELLEDKKKIFIADGLLTLVSKSWNLAFHYFLHGNLDGFFRENEELKYGTAPKQCQKWLRLVMQSRGLELVKPYVSENIDEQICSGYL